jgi:uncharacterized protein YkwD
MQLFQNFHRLPVLALAVVLACGLLGGPGAGPARADDQSDMFSLVNRDRTDASRPALTLSERLSARATVHSRRMARRREIFHSARLGAGTSENVGSGSTLALVNRAFMRSHRHRHAILDRDCSRVGVGVVHKHGMYWVTLILA